MKVLFCPDCGSLFSLSMEKEKTCDCGKVKGKYLDRRLAATNGKGLAIGVGTGDVWKKVIDMIKDDTCGDRQYYLDNFKIITWARPHCGPGNPNTIVASYEQTKTED